MADEFRHADVVSGKITENEYEAISEHIFNSQATGDILHASSPTQLSRLGIGAGDTILSVQGGIPTWRTPANILTDLSGQAGAGFDWNANYITGLSYAQADSFIGSVAVGAARFYPAAQDDAVGLRVSSGDTAGTAWLERLNISGHADTAVATWVDVTHTGLVLSGNMTVTGYAFDAGAGSAQINTTGSLEGLLVECTNDGAGGVLIQGYAVSASPAIGDILVALKGVGKDSSADTHSYGQYAILIENPTDTTECGRHIWQTWVNGGINTAMTLSSAGDLWIDRNFTLGGTATLTAPVINGAVTTTGLSLPAFTLDGALTLNGQILDAGAGSAQINTTGGSMGLKIVSTQDGSSGARIDFQVASASPAAGDIILDLLATGRDSAAAVTNYGRFTMKIESPTDTDERSYMEWSTIVAAAFNLAMTLSSAGRLWVDADIDFSTSVDSGLVADHVSLGCFDIGGLRSLAISQENPVVVAAAGVSDAYLPARVNGVDYKILLHS